MDKQAAMKVFWIIFVAVIFIASYAAFGGVWSTTTTTTSTVPQTVYGTALATATVLNYSNPLSISISCKNSTQALASAINNTLRDFESNGNISNYYSASGGKFYISSTVPSNTLYTYLSHEMNGTTLNCTHFAVSASVSLPPSALFTISSKTYTITIPRAYRSQSVSVNITRNESSSIRVKIAALITLNGTIFNMSITKA